MNTIIEKINRAAKETNRAIPQVMLRNVIAINVHTIQATTITSIERANLIFSIGLLSMVSPVFSISFYSSII